MCLTFVIFALENILLTMFTCFIGDNILPCFIGDNILNEIFS